MYASATLADKERYKKVMSFLMMKYPDSVKELRGAVSVSD